MKYLLLPLLLFVPLTANADTVRWVYNPHTGRHTPVVTESTPTWMLQHQPPDNPGINWEAVERDGCHSNLNYTVCIN